jgi:hypothetical protein
MSKAQLFVPVQQNAGFDLVRLSKSKKEVDLSPNTIRAYFQRGLPHYKMGKAIFISRAQLHQFITTQGAVQ